MGVKEIIRLVPTAGSATGSGAGAGFSVFWSDKREKFGLESGLLLGSLKNIELEPRLTAVENGSLPRGPTTSNDLNLHHADFSSEVAGSQFQIVIQKVLKAWAITLSVRYLFTEASCVLETIVKRMSWLYGTD